MTVLGVVCRPEFPPERLRETVVAADSAGLDELWLWEDCFWGGGASAAAAVLAWTSRIRVGVGVFPVPLRNVALTAMEAAMLHRLFPGRVTVGVGHGVQSWMAQVGAGVESPVTLLREYLGALRALLRGGRVTVHGRYVNLDDVALGWPPAWSPAGPGTAPRPPAVVSAATGPRTLRLSGELADGTILHSGTGPAQVRSARRLIDEGRAAAGRTDPHPLTVYLLAGADPDAAAPAGDAPAAPAGDARAVAAAVRARAEAGAGTVVLEPSAAEPDPAAFIRFAAEEVRPLLS